MIDFENMRTIIAKGLKQYLNCPVIRSNQNEEPPAYPFVSYTVTTLINENKGTYGEYEDGTDRKPFTQTWSITIQSDKNSESVELAVKAKEWFERAGTVYLNDNNIIVQSVGGITNRDNILTVEYEYRNGFDVVFWLLNEIDNPAEETGYIETVQLGENKYIEKQDTEEIIEDLEDTVEQYESDIERLRLRLIGGSDDEK